MSTETTTIDPNTPDGGASAGDPKPQETTFSQADVERIVRERLAQQAKNKFGDYDDLKTKAGESQTLEQRIAEMESRTQKAEAEALRARVAADFGVSTKKGPKGEPSDADLFLTGADVDTLTAQAQRLAAREVDRKKQGNFAPKEGTSPAAEAGSEDLREFTRKLFNKQV
jgi:hypothetical protein